MSANPIPQPLASDEIILGIATRICAELPDAVAEELQPHIEGGLRKTCSLNSAAYSKFKAEWRLSYWPSEMGFSANWWVGYELDDFGRRTVGGIGDTSLEIPRHAANLTGVIEEMPPDKFRRETKQSIPRPVELKKPDQNQSTMSQAQRGPGKRRDV